MEVEGLRLEALALAPSLSYGRDSTRKSRQTLCVL